MIFRGFVIRRRISLLVVSSDSSRESRVGTAHRIEKQNGGQCPPYKLFESRGATSSGEFFAD